MAVNYAIKADVVDITSDHPKSEDVFLVDTNVWYWMTYPNATPHFQSQSSDYPNFVNEALRKDSSVNYSGLSLAELAHLIERTERKIYGGSVRKVDTKEYRHNIAGEHSRIALNVQTAWGQVASMAEPLAVTIDAPTTTAALARLQTEFVDGYDLFILEAMKNNGVVQIITDDGDFATVPGIQVFTANRNVLNAAKRQGKLLSR